MIDRSGEKPACTKRERERKNIYCLSEYFNIYNVRTLQKTEDKTGNVLTYLLTYLLHGAESFLRS